MHAFILAGGFATRLWPLTEQRAKPLLPLAGKPILTHLVEMIPEEIPISVSTNATFKEGFEEWKQDLGRANIEIIIEDTAHDDQKLGALGATAQWLTENKIDDDLILLTGDNYFGFSFDAFLNAIEPDTALIAAHDIQDREKAKYFGTVVLDQGKVIAFEEKPTEPRSTLISTGCSFLPRSTLPILIDYAKEHPDNVGGIFEELLRKEKKINCFQFSEPWFDIGSFDAYLAATKELIGDTVHLEEGAKCIDGNQEGSIVLGRGTQVTDSTLRNVVVFEDCRIHDCVLEDCIIDDDCVLEGVDLIGKMLREGTRLVKKC